MALEPRLGRHEWVGSLCSSHQLRRISDMSGSASCLSHLSSSEFSFRKDDLPFVMFDHPQNVIFGSVRIIKSGRTMANYRWPHYKA